MSEVKDQVIRKFRSFITMTSMKLLVNVLIVVVLINCILLVHPFMKKYLEEKPVQDPIPSKHALPLSPPPKYLQEKPVQNMFPSIRSLPEMPTNHSSKSRKSGTLNNNGILEKINAIMEDNHGTFGKNKTILGANGRNLGQNIGNPGRNIGMESKSDVYLPDGKRILIMSRYRSGSSFIGNLFAQHPEVFYSAEPLQLIPHPKWDEKSKGNWKQFANVLDPIYNCNFSPLHKASLWKLDQVHSWHRLFCHKKHNEVTASSDHQMLCKTIKGSANIPSSLPFYTSEKCKKFKHVTIKTIRLRDMGILRHLIQDLNVKVIHSIRDPRGQLSSILAVKDMMDAPVETLYEWAFGICEDIKSSLDTAEQLIKKCPGLGENYRIVRYEDVALKVEAMTRKMYGFVGLDFQMEVLDWIEHSTTTTRGNTFGVVRNSKTVPLAWVKKLNLFQVLTIQKPCGDVLKRLGYALMETDKDLDHKNPVRRYVPDPFVREHRLQTWH